VEPTRHFPRQHEGARIVAVGQTSAVVGPQAQRFVLNETASALWELCDGATTPQEMVAAICLLFDADEWVIEADVERMLREFESRHLIEWVAADGEGNSSAAERTDARGEPRRRE